jgi:hypothetical protein
VVLVRQKLFEGDAEEGSPVIKESTSLHFQLHEPRAR